MNMLLNVLKSPVVQRLIGLLVVLGAITLLWKSNQRLHADNKRLSSNIKTLGAELTLVKTKSGQLAAQSDLLVLQNRELKKLFPKEVKQIENLGVKVNKTTQYSTTVVETKTNVLTTLRDSIVLDTVQVRVFDYQDQWYQIKGVIEKDKQRLVIKSMDTLTQVLFYGERQKPWLWFFSPRKLQQRVSVTNPNATIKYSQTIQIQKP
jgi:4-amino-4-deoxy-L-arabinose transferase-like glycosyltransferase